MQETLMGGPDGDGVLSHEPATGSKGRQALVFGHVAQDLASPDPEGLGEMLLAVG